MIRAAVISLAVVGSPAMAEAFVVLAYDRTAMVHAFASGPNVAAAQVEALRVCGETASRCRLAFTRANSCAGLAVDYTSGGWGVTTGADDAAANENALAHCAGFGNANCQVVETRCAIENLETN